MSCRLAGAWCQASMGGGEAVILSGVMLFCFEVLNGELVEQKCQFLEWLRELPG